MAPLALLRRAAKATANAFQSAFMMKLYPAGGSMQERGLRQMILSYQTNPWLRANLGKIARGYACVRWYVVRAKDGKAERGERMLAAARASGGELRLRMVRRAIEEGVAQEIVGHPAAALIANPTPYFFTGSTVRRLNLIYRILAGESFMLLDRMADGLPSTAFPIPPHWVIRRPSPHFPNFLISWNGYQQDVPMADVLWNLSDPNVEDPYSRGVGLGRSLSDEMDADESAARMLAYRFYNMGRPDTIVSLEGAQPEKIEEARLDWNRRNVGVTKFMRTWFTNSKATVTTLAQSFEDMRVLELRGFAKDMFRQVLGIPPEIMGDISNSNRSTIDAADFHFQKHVILPELEHDCEFLQTYLMPMYGPGFLLCYENPVAEDAEFHLKAMQARPDAFMVDEWRAMAGKPPLPGKKGQVFLVGYSTTVVEELEPSEPAEVPPQLAPGQQPPAADDPDAPEADDDEDEPPAKA